MAVKLNVGRSFWVIYIKSKYISFQKQKLSRIGGSDVKMAVKLIVDAVMTNAVQSKFNWEGRLGWKTKNNEVKRAFKPTKLCSIITSE